jgi:hypothetical protein
MARWITTLFMLLLAASAVPDNSTSDEIQRAEEHVEKECKKRWEYDYIKIKECLEKQTVSFFQFVELAKKYDKQQFSEEPNIILRCLLKHTDKQFFNDWEKIVICSEEQIEAYQAIQ